MAFREFNRRLANLCCGGLGFDLGTANTVVFSRGRGIVVRQPSVIAFRENGRTKPLAVGEAAQQMLGRAPRGIKVCTPIEDGVIADAGAAEVMLQQLVKSAYGSDHFIKPYAIICIPPNATEVDKRATFELAEMANLSPVYLIEEVMAAAIGAGIEVMNPKGSMVVDIGGGTTDVAVISLGGIVATESNLVAGKALNRKIAEFVKESREVFIGEQTTELLKTAVATTKPNGGPPAEIRGRHLRNGLPKSLEITESELYEAIREPIDEIIAMIKRVLEETPPELAADIIDSGITLVGGGALLRDLDRTISEETGLAVSVAEDPLSCAAVGAGMILQDYQGYKTLLQDSSRK